MAASVDGQKIYRADVEKYFQNQTAGSTQPLSDEQLVQQIKETADKLIRDHCNRGDLKLLTTALKELRYAFKVFAPYRQMRKVTVSGSARLSSDKPAYQQAVEFRYQRLLLGELEFAQCCERRS